MQFSEFINESLNFRQLAWDSSDFDSSDPNDPNNHPAYIRARAMDKSLPVRKQLLGLLQTGQISRDEYDELVNLVVIRPTTTKKLPEYIDYYRQHKDKFAQLGHNWDGSLEQEKTSSPTVYEKKSKDYVSVGPDRPQRKKVEPLSWNDYLDVQQKKQILPQTKRQTPEESDAEDWNDYLNVQQKKQILPQTKRQTPEESDAEEIQKATQTTRRPISQVNYFGNRPSGSGQVRRTTNWNL